MAHDLELARRIRSLLEREPDVHEKRMFGGVGFMVGGNLAIAASGQGGVLVRVDPDKRDRLLRTTPAEVAVMQGRPMAGWLRVASEHVESELQLSTWVQIGAEYARSLPAKP